jgi:PPOX class probable F420-dependent enzyme
MDSQAIFIYNEIQSAKGAKMNAAIPPQFLDLFEKRAFGHLATIMPDGSPHVTPVWVDYDGRFILVTSTKGSQKDHNMRRDGHVAIDVQDPENPYRYLLVRGLVIEIFEEGAAEYFDKLNMKYLGVSNPGKDPNWARAVYKIEPIKVATSRR